MKTLFEKARLIVLMIVVTLAMTAPAFAGGVAPNTLISNTAYLDYSVGTTPQTQLDSGPVTFVVDRLVAYSVSNGGNLSVQPNATGQILSFTVTNSGNETYDFDINAAQTAGTFTASNLVLYDEIDGTPGYDGGVVDQPISTIDNLGVDASKTIYVTGDIPDTATNGQIATITLTVTDVKDSAGNAMANNDTDANGDNTVETAWAQTPPTATSADYVVGAADLSISKGYVIISDPAGSTVPKAIPGAIIEYTLTIDNGTGASTAVDVTLTDDAPANTSYVAGSTTVDGSGIADGAGSTCPLATGYNVGNVAADTSIVVKFRVTID